MADIKFFCPHCNQSMEGPEEMTGQLLDCPNCGKPIELRPISRTRPFTQGLPVQPMSTTVETNVKQGAIIGSSLCLVIGLGFMVWSLFFFIAYVPLFFAAFVLSIVAMAQKRIVGGILLLLASCIIPGILFLALSAHRAGQAMESMSKEIEKNNAEMKVVLDKMPEEMRASQQRAIDNFDRNMQKALEESGLNQSKPSASTP